MKMMSSALNELKGAVEPAAPELTIDLPVNAFIPASYVARESLRMDAYRHLERLTTEADIAAFTEELEDRYGPVPEATSELIQVARLRVLMMETEIEEISMRDGILKATPVALKDSQEVRMKRLFERSAYKPASDAILIPVPPGDITSWVIETLRAILA
jgi:transcription-repair coupling factor (superfamily II helicase)